MEFKGHVDFRACGQAAFRKAAQGQLVVECKRRPEIGYFDPMSIIKQVDSMRDTYERRNALNALLAKL